MDSGFYKLELLLTIQEMVSQYPAAVRTEPGEGECWVAVGAAYGFRDGSKLG